MIARPSLTAALLVAAFAPGLAAILPAERAAVTCDVVVIDAAQAPIANLTKNDIEVTSDGAPVPIASFAPAPPEVTMMLLVDMSTSQPLKRYEVHAAIANDWLPNLLPADRVRVGVIGSPPAFGSWLTGDRSMNVRSARATVDLALSEPSPIWDSTSSAVQMLAGERGTRMIVLVSDGRATANTIGVDELARRAVAADVTIAVISEGTEVLVPQVGGPLMRIRTDATLRSLADATGGLYLEDGAATRVASPRLDAFAWAWDLVHKPNQPGKVLARLMTATRGRYRLTFDGTADRKVHTLEVRVKTDGAVVRAKRSYVGG